jgi:predicted regulator of Ras-like GTPase activity (Roadblock/LC7/MglB family)
MLVMMVALPQVLTALGAAGMEPEERARPASRKASGSDVAPAGGFVQVFSFEELAGFLRKTSGLEGFLILSGEGLVVWRDLPARLQVDEIGARLQNMAADTSEITEGTGLARLRSSMFQTREHLVVVSELNQNFSLILFYNARTSLADCESRLTMLVRTAREFLQWKYPGLALAGTGASQTAVPTGT